VTGDLDESHYSLRAASCLPSGGDAVRPA